MRGIRRGWLEALRISAGSRPGVPGDFSFALPLMDSCSMWRKHWHSGLTVKDDLRRAAILDCDPRGGAFALILAIEIASISVDF